LRGIIHTPMSQTAIVLDTDVDPLWLRHLPRSPKDKTGNQQAHSDRIISLRSLSTTHYPYFRDVPGWRRWFKRNDIHELRCYLPGRKSWAILSAAVLGSIPISLYMTQYIEPRNFDYLKLWKHRTNRFYCAGNFISQQLQTNGVAADRIIVEEPVIQVSPSSEVDLEQYKNQLKLPSDNYTLLSLVPPQDLKALKDIVWTAAIVKHVFPDIRLIISGEYGREDRLRLSDWERIFKASNMLVLHPKPEEWDMLVQVCDVVLAAGACGKEAIRLHYAQAAAKPIVAGGKEYNEFINGYKNAFLVHPPTPRQFASTILDLMQGATTQ
jgi:hypothetical protein